MFFKAIVGLGNPGIPYENTRHNMGYIVADNFVKTLGCGTWKHERALSASLLKIPWNDGQLLVIRADKFINLSGESVAKVCSFFKIKSAEVVVICDDITFDLGTIKITERPGTAGHNGVRNILEKIGPGFIRFRVGIGGKKHGAMDLGDHVLGKFSAEELEILAKKMPNICDNLKLLLDKGVLSAMNIANRSICEQNLIERL
jgi:PTH1 family peptidyl-tRNA hydrolase